MCCICVKWQSIRFSLPKFYYCIILMYIYISINPSVRRKRTCVFCLISICKMIVLFSQFTHHWSQIAIKCQHKSCRCQSALEFTTSLRRQSCLTYLSMARKTCSKKAKIYAENWICCIFRSTAYRSEIKEIFLENTKHYNFAEDAEDTN